MTPSSQHENHLDADQLNAFAEGALSASERALCLQHLAECAHCRDIAFLANSSLPSEQPVAASKHKFRFPWWPVLSLGAATLAAATIILVLLHHPYPGAHPATVQIATESSVTQPPPATTGPPMNQPAPSESTANAILKPSPARKAAPKSGTQRPENRQANDAITLDSLSTSAQPPVPIPQQQAAAGTTRGLSNATVAAPGRAQAAEAARAAPAFTLRTYSAAGLRTPDGLAQVAGTITDASGAAVPHAKVTLDQTSGTAHREALADGAGRFTIGSLQPGKYRLEISSPGFAAEVREVELGTSQLAQINSKLAVGAASETVEVTAAAPTLNTESASVQSFPPSQKVFRISVSSGTRTLALDPVGRLFLSKKAGKRWKTAHGPWKKSAITDLSLTQDQQFKVTTGEGSWLSADGEHWHPAN